jgi:hypothetical protein
MGGNTYAGLASNRHASLSYYWDIGSGAFAVSGDLESSGDWEGTVAPETALRSWVSSWGDSCEIGSIAVQVVSPLAWKGNIFNLKLAGTCLPANADEAGRIRVSLPVLPVALTTPPSRNEPRPGSCRAVLPPSPAMLH